MTQSTTRPLSRTPIAALVLALTLGLPACSTTGGGGGGGGSRNEITYEQVSAQPDGTAFTVIQALRGSWLRARTQGTLGNPEPSYARVWLNDLSFGDIESLHNVQSSEISRMEFINARDATTRYGTGYPGGIIHIHTLGR